MKSSALRLDIEEYTRPKNEEDARTLNESGYRKLSIDEALELAEKMGKPIVGNKAFGRVQNLIKGGEGELRCYTEDGAASLGWKHEGEGVYVFLKEGGRVLPIFTQKPGSRSNLKKI